MNFNPFSEILSNPAFLLIEAVELAGQVLIMFFGGNWFKVKRLDWEHWLICIIMALLEFPVQTVIVLFKKLYDQKRGHKLASRESRLAVNAMQPQQVVDNNTLPRVQARPDTAKPPALPVKP